MVATDIKGIHRYPTECVYTCYVTYLITYLYQEGFILIGTHLLLNSPSFHNFL